MPLILNLYLTDSQVTSSSIQIINNMARLKPCLIEDIPTVPRSGQRCPKGFHFNKSRQTCIAAGFQVGTTPAGKPRKGYCPTPMKLSSRRNKTCCIAKSGTNIAPASFAI